MPSVVKKQTWDFWILFFFYFYFMLLKYKLRSLRDHMNEHLTFSNTHDSSHSNHTATLICLKVGAELRSVKLVNVLKIEMVLSLSLYIWIFNLWENLRKYILNIKSSVFFSVYEGLGGSERSGTWIHSLSSTKSILKKKNRNGSDLLSVPHYSAQLPPN